MRRAAIIGTFISEENQEIIEKKLKSEGFFPEFFDDSAGALKRMENSGEASEDYFEIAYGAVDPAFLQRASKLKWCASSMAGVDKLLLDPRFREGECILSNSAGAYGVTIAEHIVMVILMLLRREPEYFTMMQERGWGILPGDIHGMIDSRITVLGAGDIGTEFAKRARAFRPASVTGIRRTEKTGDPVFDRILSASRLDEVLPETDILVMALPGTGETANLLDRRRMELLPSHAVIVNVGRGSSLDQDALIELLNAGRIAGAAVDVTVPEPLPEDHPLRSARNLLLTPHISGNMTLEYTRNKDIRMFLEDFERYVSGKELLHRVDKRVGY